jgi:predicted dehydrogenase
MKKKLNIAIIGHGFMGRAHSNAWIKLPKFFDINYEPVLKVVVGGKNPVEEFAEKWGFEETSYDWKEVIARDDIDVVAILTPTGKHKEIAIAAMKAGKHVICEKPCALNYQECVEMANVAKETGVVNLLNHNYRRVPAIMLAKKMIDEGAIGDILHYRGAYLQEWIIDPDFPLTWHLRKETAGGGPLYDLGSHAVDIARFLIGEPTSVMGSCKTFVKERPAPGAVESAFAADGSKVSSEKLPVTVDDAAFFVVDFENGALGSFDTSRFSAGRKNYNSFEINGTKGSITFDLERMNELEYYNAEDLEDRRGFRTIIVTEGCHDYVGNWWPQGHIIGYEHTFVHAFYEFCKALETNGKASPDFEDGAKILRVLNAVQKSSIENRRVDVNEIK